MLLTNVDEYIRYTKERTNENFQHSISIARSRYLKKMLLHNNDNNNKFINRLIAVLGLNYKWAWSVYYTYYANLINS